MKALIKKPSAWVPILMSGAALALLLGYVAVFSVSQEQGADERAAARLFQLLIVGQVPFVLYFAATQVPRAKRAAFHILALQLLAVLLPLALLFWLER